MSEIPPVFEDGDNISDESKPSTCPLSRYDCADVQLKESSVQEHYVSERHQKAVVRCVQQFIKSKDGDFPSTSDMDEEQSQLTETYDKLSMITRTTENNCDELSQLEDKIFPLSNEDAILSEQLQDIQRDHLMEKTQRDALSINQSVLTQHIAALKQRMENHSEIARQGPDGTMVWKITNVLEKMYDAQSERQTSIYSSPFYTSVPGYRICVRLYLNGDGSARGTHASIFVVILRGAYDAFLTWPFSYRVSFCLYDQRTMLQSNGTIQPKHIIESFRPDITSISFEQPCSEMNIASGIPRFFALDQLDPQNNRNLYVINDTMYIKTFIDFIGIPRAILPFVFNINIAFPAHIQQKLILDEIKRHGELTTNQD